MNLDNKKYEKMRIDIIEKVQNYTKYPFTSLNDYKIAFNNFFIEIHPLQVFYKEFNTSVIRKNHYLNPCRTTTQSMRYLEEIVGETWYFMVHVVNCQSIITDMILKNISIYEFSSIENSIVDLFNQDLQFQNLLNTLEIIFKSQTFSILEFNEKVFGEKPDFVDLYYQYSIEKTQFTEIINDCLQIKNTAKLKSYFLFTEKYKILQLEYYEILKNYYCKKTLNENSLITFQTLSTDQSFIPNNLINSIMKSKVFGQEITIAAKILDQKDYFNLVPYLSNEELFISYLRQNIIKECLKYGKMYINKLPDIFSSHYVKLVKDFKQESFDYPKLFVFNDTFSYKTEYPNLIIPMEILEIQKQHTQSYQNKYPQRKLKWIYEKSFVTFILDNNLFKVDFLTFLVLHLFKNHTFLNFDLIQENTGISQEQINYILQTLTFMEIIKKLENQEFVLQMKENYNFEIDNYREKQNHYKELLLSEEKCKLAILYELKKKGQQKKVDVINLNSSVNVSKILENLVDTGYLEIKDNIVYYIP
jgi:hypothetical protein